MLRSLNFGLGEVGVINGFKKNDLVIFLFYYIVNWLELGNWEREN